MFVSKKKYRQLEATNVLLQKELDLYKEISQRPSRIIEKDKLTRGEAECLKHCIFEYLGNYPIQVDKQWNQTPQFLSKLTKKGYLKRIKRNHYQLTFVKYD